MSFVKHYGKWWLEEWLAVIFLCLVLIHLALHWRWIVAMIKGNGKKR